MMLAGVLLVLAAVLPWQLVRWACLTLSLFLFASSLWSRVLRRFLVVKSDFPRDRTFSGQKTDVHYRLENRSLLPAGLVFLADSAGNLETFGKLRHFLSPGPLSRARFRHSLRGRERGLVSLGPFTLTGSDPSGLFPFRKVQRDDRSLVVYPPLRPVPRWFDDGVPPGPRQKDLYWAEDNTRFRSYREFRDGDELSRLVASASSRWKAPVVRTFDRTRAFPALVFLDVRLETYPLKQRWALIDRAVETAATLVWEMLLRGEVVWLSVVGHRPEGEERWGPGRDGASAALFLEFLALLKPVESGSVPWDEPSWWGSLPSPPLRVLRVFPRPDKPQLGDLDAPWRLRWTVSDVVI